MFYASQSISGTRITLIDYNDHVHLTTGPLGYISSNIIHTDERLLAFRPHSIHVHEKKQRGRHTRACTRQYGSIVIRLAVIASQICKIPRISPKIRTYRSSRSSKAIDLVANRKRLLVINSNFALYVSPTVFSRPY